MTSQATKQEGLGNLTLIATAPSRKARYLADGLTAFLAVVALATVPRAALPAIHIPAFLPSYGTAVLICDFLTAYLLFSHARVARSASLSVLASAYLYSGLMAAVQVAMFPGLVSASGGLGAGPQSAIWAWMFWHGGFPFFVLLYILVRLSERRGGRWPSQLPHREVMMSATLILVIGLGVIAGHADNWLPVIVSHGSYRAAFKVGAAQAVIGVNIAALLGLTIFERRRTVLQVWLWVAMVASLLDAIIALAGGARYSLGWYVARADDIVASAVIFGAFLGEMVRLYDLVFGLNVRLAEVVALDALTGIPNRRRFDEALSVSWRQAKRDDKPVSLLILDIDFFKNYNDALGHPAGDACLRAVAQALAASVTRPHDLVARYGGEEFAILLPGTDLAGAMQVATRCCQAVANLHLCHPQGVDGSVSVSAGGAARQGGEGTADELVAAADRALYEAKKKGRAQCQWEAAIKREVATP